MKIVATILIFVAILAILAIGDFCLKWLSDKKETEPEINEPDLDLVEKPDLIGKIPENEDVIPDANAGKKLAQ